MSILIKGMEMPTDHPLWIVVHSDGTVEANEVSPSRPVGWQTLRKAAVPVPAHGDLIDHNALKIAVMDCDAETRIDFLKHAMDCINKAPVVIPSDMPTYEAEEGET